MLPVLYGKQGLVKQALSVRLGLVHFGAVPKPLLDVTVADSAVIDALELGHASSHIDVILLSFGTLLVKELINRIILRLELKQDRHNHKERFTKIRRSALATGLAVRNLVT